MERSLDVTALHDLELASIPTHVFGEGLCLVFMD